MKRKLVCRLTALCSVMAVIVLFAAARFDYVVAGQMSIPDEEYISVTIGDHQVPLSAGTKVLVPETGKKTHKGGSAVVDYSNCDQGYIMVKFSGGNKRIKVQVSKGGKTYTYDLNNGGTFEVLPLTLGDGKYKVSVFQNISGTSYSQVMSCSIEVELKNQNLPYLYPNQYVNFDKDSKTVKKGEELAGNVDNDLETVSKIYNFVINNISYDKRKAETVKPGYLPVVDSILAAKKGICFDYAALMTAMLRSQQIPTRLEIGYVSNGAYHAWISTYIKDKGWINGVIQFDGKNWKLMDPTFASSGGSNIMKYIGDGKNYQMQYKY